jgi:hypothetical protein
MAIWRGSIISTFPFFQLGMVCARMALMSQRKMILIAVLIGTAVALLSFFYNVEPTYNGKPLGLWVIQFATTDGTLPAHKEAQQAIQEIGTNAIPYLIKWIGEAKVVGDTRPVFDSDIPELRARTAPMAFAVFRSRAESAVPALTRMLNESDEAVSTQAGKALWRIGEVGLPSLIAGLDSKKTTVRRTAMGYLVMSGRNARPAIPALLKA